MNSRYSFFVIFAMCSTWITGMETEVESERLLPTKFIHEESQLADLYRLISPLFKIEAAKITTGYSPWFTAKIDPGNFCLFNDQTPQLLYELLNMLYKSTSIDYYKEKNIMTVTIEDRIGNLNRKGTLVFEPGQDNISPLFSIADYYNQKYRQRLRIEGNPLISKLLESIIQQFKDKVVERVNS